MIARMKQYYYSDDKNEQQGPIDEAVFIERVKAGQYSAQTKFWCEGMENWQGVEDLRKSLKEELPAIERGSASPRAKSLPMRWFLVGGAAVLLLLVGYFMFPLGCHSSEDVQSIMDEKMELLKLNAPQSSQGGEKIYQEFFEERGAMRLAIRGGVDEKGTAYSLALLAGFNENDALEYLVEKRSVAPTIDEKYMKLLFVCALAAGDDFTVRYLVEQGYRMEGKRAERRLELLVCRFGRAELLRWMVDGGYCALTMKDVKALMLDVIRCRNLGYDEVMEAYALFGNKVSLAELKKGHLDVVDYLANHMGGELDDSTIQLAASLCPNSPLRKKILKTKI